MKEQEVYVSQYLPKSVADKFNAAKEISIQEAVIEDYIKSSKDIFKESLEELELELKEYRLMMQKTVIEVKKAREEMLNYEYNLWEQFDKERKNLQRKVSEIKSELEPLDRELRSISSTLSNIGIWNAEKLLSVIDRLQDSCSSKNMSMLKFLINNYKSE